MQRRLTGTSSEVPALLSIIINNHNYGRFLRQSVESALAQTHPRVEVVVVDDASTDGSREIIGSFGSRIVPLLRERNDGQGAALNDGFATSHGDIVIFLDSDDYLYPQAAERVVSACGPGVGTVQYRLHLVDADGSIVDLYPAGEVRFDRGDVVAKLVATGRYEGTVTSGIAFTRSTLSAVLPIPAERFRVGADGYVVTAAPFHGAIASIDEPLGAYRRHHANQWMCRSISGEGFRRAILHDAEKHRVLRECAAARGLPVALQPGLRDYQHVGVRLGSLILEPERHPLLTDTRPGLAVDGFLAALRASLPPARRAVLAAWYLGLGALPRRLARHLIRWRYLPDSRSRPVRAGLKLLRAATR
jgi:hypothetical protein